MMEGTFLNTVWTVLQVLHDLFLWLLFGGSFYLFGLTIAALWREKRQEDTYCQSPAKNSFHHRFVLLIPAHNEEKGILGTIRSLQQLSYPKEQYRIVVISDNSDDKTTDIALQNSVTVLERVDPSKRGKGYALRFAFSHLLKDPSWDACVIIDADSVLSENTLQVLNSELNRGGSVFQLNDQIEPQSSSWSSEIIRLGFFLYNYIRPLGKSFLGLPVGLRGNGMCFRRSVIEIHPWEAFSLAEDLEYGLTLISKGEYPVFVPEATVLAKMPDNSRDAMSQRRRWELGRWPLLYHYSVQLLTRPTVKRMETVIDLFIPPLANFMLLLVSGFSLWALVILSTDLSLSHLTYAGVIWVTSISFLIGHLTLGLSSNRADSGLKKALNHAPRYVIWKMYVYFQAILKGREREWIRTRRR